VGGAEGRLWNPMVHSDAGSVGHLERTDSLPASHLQRKTLVTAEKAGVVEVEATIQYSGGRVHRRRASALCSLSACGEPGRYVPSIQSAVCSQTAQSQSTCGSCGSTARLRSVRAAASKLHPRR